MDNAEITLPEHEQASEKRAEHIAAKIDNLKESKMGQPVNVFTTPTSDGGGAAAMIPAALMAGMGGNAGHAGAIGGGLGAGLVGGLLGGLLFGRGGIGGIGVDGAAAVVSPRDACLTAEMSATQTMGLATAIGAVSDKVAAGDMALMNTIGAGFASQGQMTLQQTIMMIQQLNAQNLTTMQELCGINTNVSAQGCMTREAVNADGTATRALITAQYEANLQRELGVAQVALLEAGRRRDHEQVIATITNTNTAVAAQAQGQAQAQQQQIAQGIAQLFPLVQGVLQVAHATNTNVIAGNSGAVVTGPQTANPTNVNA